MENKFNSLNDFINHLSKYYNVNTYNNNINHKYVIKFCVKQNSDIINQFLCLFFDEYEIVFRKKQLINYVFIENNILHIDVETYYDNVFNLKIMRKNKLNTFL